MLQVKVIATDVENLTDARYFAAMGVDAVCFDLGAISPEVFYAIKDWIEGVRVYVKGTAEESDADATIVQAASDFVAERSIIVESSYEDIKDAQLPSGQIINEHRHWDKHEPYLQEEIIAFAFDHQHYLHIPWTKELLSHTLDQDKLFGIVVSGGVEEKIGYKSFLELDELFDIIEEE